MEPVQAQRGMKGIQLEEPECFFVLRYELGMFFDKPARPFYITVGIPYLSHG